MRSYSQERMNRLLKVGILPSLPDSLESCVKGIKGKLTKLRENDLNLKSFRNYSH